jgi:hypothetical protein
METGTGQMPESAEGFGGAGIAHPGKPVYAVYVDGECVAMGTAKEVARRMGVKPSTVYCAVAPSRNSRIVKRVEYARFYEEEE